MRRHPTFHDWFNLYGKTIDAIAFDVDGVLIRGREPIPGAPDLLRELRRRRVPFGLLTNDGCHSPEEKSGFLRACGMDVGAEDLISCGHGLEELKEKHGWTDTLFYVLGSLGTPCFAERIGLRVTRRPEEIDQCAGVIVGEKRYDWHDHITAAYNFFLRHPDRLLIAPNPDETYPHGAGLMGVASGATTRLIQRLCAAAGTTITPVYLGKPHAPIFEHFHHFLEKRLNRAVDRNRVLMVGDSLTSDIPGGQSFGYQTALTLTGMTTEEMLRNSPEKPDIVIAALT
ncbi:MAG: HAD-IIA family hydrolase [Lentisphaeria bacterium]|nr:HAD-IIA family hydrolase [Lentisphaeria bacterium]